MSRGRGCSVKWGLERWGGGRRGRASRAFLRTLNVGLNEVEPQRVQESEGPDPRAAACRTNTARAAREQQGT